MNCRFSAYCKNYRPEGFTCRNEDKAMKGCESYGIFGEFIQLYGYFPNPNLKYSNRFAIIE